MFSEATAAHPYSQRANIELGAHETGFLLGWIPASVANDAAAGAPRRRQSAALFYTKLNDGHERARLRARAPPRDRRPDAGAVRAARDAGEPPAGRRAGGAHRAAGRGRRGPQPGPDHGRRARAPTSSRCSRAERHHLFHRRGLDAIYVDLPLEQPATALVADDLERLGVSYAGVFPNHRTDGDVLRMQSLHRVRVKADDIAVASDHGRELLDYVLGGPAASA